MKYKFILLLLFPMVASFGQTIKNATKVIEFLGAERYNETLSSNPGLVYFLDAKAEFGYEIIDLIQGKESDFQFLDAIPVVSKTAGSTISPEEFLSLHTSGQLNFLMYNFTCLPKETSYFKLGHTGKALVVHSAEYVNSKITE